MHYSTRDVLVDNQLYKTMGSWPLLKCISEEDDRYVLQEIHEGIYGSHIGSKALVSKSIRYRYYWSTMKKDYINLVKTCTKCQIHTNKHHILMSNTTPLIP